jgi:HK97 family phage major capsid protein
MEKFMLVALGLLAIFNFMQNGLGNAYAFAFSNGARLSPFQKLLHSAAALVFFTAEDAAKEVKKLGEEIGKTIEKTNKQVEETGKIAEDTKTELKGLAEKFNKAQEQLDKLDTLTKRLGEGGDNRPKSFKGKVLEALEKGKDTIKGLRNVSGKSYEIDIDTKAIVLESSALTGDVIDPDRRPGVVVAPERQQHVRSLMSVGQTSSNKWSYTEETAYTDGTAMTAEGAAYGKSDFTLEQKSVDVKKVTAAMDLSEEILEDIPGLYTYLNGRLMQKLMNREDNQILFGDGTGNNLRGVYTAGTAFAAGTTVVAKPQKWDVLATAWKQLRIAEYSATAVIVSPVDLLDMALTKDDEGRYLLPIIFMNSGGQKTVMMVPVIDNTYMTAGNFLMGDFQRAAELIDRRQVSIQISTENKDNFEKGLVTVRLAERLALPIYFPQGFVKGTFTAGITDITTA